MKTLSAIAGDFPIVLGRPTRREDLKWLSPLIVGGWESQKSQQVAAWLDKMGDPTDPWALVLKADEDSLPYLECYSALRGWTVLINEEPSCASTPRIYLFEDVWYLPGSNDNPPPPVHDILALADEWPVIIVPDPEGMLPDYLEPTRQMTKELLYQEHSLKMVGWGRSNLSATLPDAPYPAGVLTEKDRQNTEDEWFARQRASSLETRPTATAVSPSTVRVFQEKIRGSLRKLFSTTKYEDAPNRRRM